MRDIHKSYPSVFIQKAIDFGLHVVQKMTKIEAAAMWIEANVSFTQARVILRHLYDKFGHRVQVPFNQIATIGNITTTLEPVFEEFKYKQDDKSSEKIGETIKLWTYNVCDLLELDFARLLQSMSSDTSSTPTYSYNSNAFDGTNKKGVFCIMGADHGGGKSRYLIRVNYLVQELYRLQKCNANEMYWMCKLNLHLW